MNVTNFIKKVGAITPTLTRKVASITDRYLYPQVEEAIKSELDTRIMKNNLLLRQCYR